MPIKFPFDTHKPIEGSASIEIYNSIETVFDYIAERFFDNYPKWAEEVVDFEPLTGKKVFVGAKAKQIREDNGIKVESVFEITDYQPQNLLCFQGVSAPYKHTYVLASEQEQPTQLTFTFELLEIDVFMRPFEKLIRSAIVEGAENTVENIKKLIQTEYA
jgi:hypothetical protein